MSSYEKFEKHMAEKYPRYCGDNAHFGGFAIGEGWYHIIEQLIAEIDHYTKWRRKTRTYDLKLDRARDKGRDAVLSFICKGRTPKEWDEERADEIMKTPHVIADRVDWIRIQQIKEKFGGLRFYYDGGNDEISGMVRMAELWAGHTCEKCGNKGERRSGGWVRTLCDVHEAEYQARRNSDE